MNYYIKKVENLYSKDDRKYHTLFHIENMFNLYEYFKNGFLNEFPNLNEDNLFNAIAYHDSIYVPGCKLNEDLSAKVYKNQADNPNDIVYNAILSTSVDNITYNNDIEKVLHDLDWSGFSDYEIMKQNEGKILFEVLTEGIYEISDILKNQKKFYELIADRNIYVTNAFKPFNEQTKNNIKRRIVEFNEKYAEHLK